MRRQETTSIAVWRCESLNVQIRSYGDHSELTMALIEFKILLHLEQIVDPVPLANCGI